MAWLISTYQHLLSGLAAILLAVSLTAACGGSGDSAGNSAASGASPAPEGLPDARPADCPLVMPPAAEPYSTIRVVTVDGASRTIASLPEDAGGRPMPSSAMSWSPDGARLALTVWDGDAGEHVICVVAADGSGASGFTLGSRARDGAAYEELRTGVVWSPDGSSLALAGDGEIYVVRPDGTKLLRVTDDNYPDFGPAWSPDSTRLVFSSERDDDPNRRVQLVFVADVADRERATLSGGWDGAWPAWLPDGRIAYSRWVETDWDIQTADADGSNAQPLVHMSTSELYPVPSPDGAWIACMAFALDGPGSLYVIGAESREIVLLGQAAGYPAWSPDGRQLAYSESSGIRIAKAGVWEPGDALAGAGKADRAVWSPDGEQLAVMTWGGKNLPGGN
jgi:dipeptidyl aminopeptidase/acylaminoacyl peptidase